MEIEKTDSKNDLQILWTNMLSGNISETMSVFQTRLQSAPEVRENWSGLIGCLCASGQIDQATHILDQRQTNFQDAPPTLLEVMMAFASTRQEKLLKYLHDNWPEDRPDRVIVYYHYGHLLLELGNYEEANCTFQICKDLFIEHQDILKVHYEGDLYSLFRQCVNLVSQKNLLDLSSKNENISSKLLGPINWKDTDKKVGFSIGFVAADKLYVEAFGEDFLKSLTLYWPRDTPFHIHIADVAKDEHETFIDTIRNMAPNIDLRISLNSKPKDLNLEKSAYYASLRFFLMNELLERYNGAVITFDIDMIVHEDLSPIIDAANQYDYCRYKRNSYGPGGHDYAALTSFNGEGGRLMSRLTASIINFRMEESSKDLWFVDQTALYQASDFLHRSLPNDFNQGSFFDHIENLEHYFDHLDAQEIKLRISRLKSIS